ncbi:helix-turn-helix domain-containing protein [Acidobacteriota bacterium]
MQRRWISVKECAEYLGLHLKSVYSLISRGEIPAARIGGSVRVDLKKLDSHMESTETVPIRNKIEEWL